MNYVNNLYYFIRGTGENVIPIERSVIEFYHLMIVFKGNFTFFANGEKITVKENDALILPPGTSRERLPHPDKSDYAIFNFRYTKDNECPSYVLFKNAVTPYIRKLLDSYSCKYYNDLSCSYDFYISPHYKIDNSKELAKMRGILHNHLNCILIELFDSLNTQSQNRYVNSAIKFINDNITSTITLTDVSNAIYLSKEYTARIFKKEMNMTVTDFILHQKLLLAKDLLTSDEMTLKKISEKLGYQDYNYFSRIFKKHFGISPIKMKNQLLKQLKNN